MARASQRGVRPGVQTRLDQPVRYTKMVTALECTRTQTNPTTTSAFAALECTRTQTNPTTTSAFVCACRLHPPANVVPIEQGSAGLRGVRVTMFRKRQSRQGLTVVHKRMFICLTRAHVFISTLVCASVKQTRSFSPYGANNTCTIIPSLNIVPNGLADDAMDERQQEQVG